jgi:predicted nuclease of predicted toxin-antitoxin system
MIALARRRSAPACACSADETLGHSADHVFDCGRATASDDAIRTYAAKIGAVVVTRDEDFVVRRVLQEGPAVVWVRIGSTRRPELLRRIEGNFTAIVAALERGETLVELA